jgi:hypothetical protein
MRKKPKKVLLSMDLNGLCILNFATAKKEIYESIRWDDIANWRVEPGKISQKKKKLI